MEWLDWLRWAHILGATVLIGTGAGIAFFMMMAHRTRDARVIAHVAGTVVVADALFTATAVIIQPVTGLVLADATGWPLTSWWILASVALYGLIGLCWLPVVWIQIRIRDLARRAAAHGEALPVAYTRLYRIWTLLGIPAFSAILAIVALMVARPV